MDAARHYCDGQQQPQQVAESNGDDVPSADPQRYCSDARINNRCGYTAVFREETFFPKLQSCLTERYTKLHAVLGKKQYTVRTEATVSC